MRRVLPQHVEYVRHDTLVSKLTLFFIYSLLDLYTLRYVECSSKHNRGVKEVFYEVARVSLTTRARGQSGGGGPNCVVM